MIKFEIKDRKTGKTESYTKEDVTMGEAEKCYEYLELVNQENKKEAPNATKMRQKERQLLVDLFKDEGLTEEDVLNKMSTKTYTKALQDIFFEKSMVKMKKIQKLNQKRWERQKNNLNKRHFIEH